MIHCVIKKIVKIDSSETLKTFNCAKKTLGRLYTSFYATTLWRVKESIKQCWRWGISSTLGATSMATTVMSPGNVGFVTNLCPSDQSCSRSAYAMCEPLRFKSIHSKYIFWNNFIRINCFCCCETRFERSFSSTLAATRRFVIYAHNIKTAPRWI